MLDDEDLVVFLQEFDPSPSTTTPLTTNEKCHSPQTPNFDSCHPFPNYYGEGDLNASSSILLDQHLTRDEPDFAMETFTRVKRESQESPAQSLSKPSASLQKDSVPMLSSVEFTNAILPPSTFAHLSSALSYSEDGPKHENIQVWLM